MKRKRKLEVYALMWAGVNISPKDFHKKTAVTMSAIAQQEANNRQDTVSLIGESRGYVTYSESFYPQVVGEVYRSPRVIIHR